MPQKTDTLDGVVSNPEGWQPIETAPKDGVPFLIHSQGRIGLAFIDPRNHEGLRFNAVEAVIAGPDPWNDHKPGIAMSKYYLDVATHWMPLPPPPAKARGLHPHTQEGVK